MHQLNAQAWFKNVKNVWMYKHRVIFDSYLRVFFGAANILANISMQFFCAALGRTPSFVVLSANFWTVILRQAALLDRLVSSLE